MSRRALQGNAADAQQVRYAERKARQAEELFHAAVQQVMTTQAGRLMLWGLLERAGIYRSVFDAQGSRVYYNAGRQDYGHELLAILLEQSPTGYLQMEAEARRREASTDRESEAVQAAAARESDHGD